MRLSKAVLAVVVMAGLCGVAFYLGRCSQGMKLGPSSDRHGPSFYNRFGESIGEHRGGLRVVMDPFAIYANYPDQTGGYHIDSHGFRGGCQAGKEWKAMVMGGSSAFGYGLTDENHTLARCLDRLNPQFDFINTGVIGYLSGQELAQMVFRLDEFHPRLYIVFDGWNDLWEPFGCAVLRKERWAPLGYNSAYFEMQTRLADYAKYHRGQEVVPNLPTVEPLVNSQNWFDRAMGTYVSNIERMHAFARSRGAQFLVVLQPELGCRKQLTVEEKKAWDASNPYFGGVGRHQEFHHLYGELARQVKLRFQAEEVACIDLNQERRFTDEPDTLFLDALHLNLRGNQVAADIINRNLQILNLGNQRGQ